MSFFRTLFVLVLLMSTSACSDTLQWKEEVQLNDGRVISVEQKRRCEGGYTGGNMASCIEREAWLTVALPEQERGNNVVRTVWHQNLKPLILNSHEGQWYIVGIPATQREFTLYGKPYPPYLGFRLEGEEWKQIPFSAIPEAVYETNLIIDGGLLKITTLTLSTKNSREFNGDPTYPDYVKKIDPHYRSKFD